MVDKSLDLFEEPPIVKGIEGSREIIVEPNPGWENSKTFQFNVPA